MSKERLSADEIIELGADRKAVPVFEIRGVMDAWLSKLGARVTDLVALQDHLGDETAGSSFFGWARRLSRMEFPALAQATPPERWEVVRRTAYELLGAAQAFARDQGAYLSREEEESLGMEMDRTLAAIDRAELVARPLRVGLRDAADALSGAAVQDLSGASASLSGLLAPKRKGA